MTVDLEALRSVPAGADHTAVEDLLLRRGWSRCGVGDWAVVLRSPHRELAARISPFDPAAPFTIELFRRAAPTGQVPVLHDVVALDGGGVCTVMELLQPVEPEVGTAFFRALQAREPHVADLAGKIEEVLARARVVLPWCGPVDPNPSNVMCRVDGTLVLTDPFYADGKKMYGSLLTDPLKVARAIPAEARRHMFDLPLAESGPWDPEARERMRVALADADAQVGSGRTGDGDDLS